MFLNGTQSGLTAEQADLLQKSLQERADFEHATVVFARSGASSDVTLSWTIVTPVGTDQRAERAFHFFATSSWNDAQSAGLVGNIEAESSFNPNVPGDGGTAFGLCQWHPDRQVRFQKRFGKPIQQAGFDEQLAFVNFELLDPDGGENPAGKKLKAAGSAAEAGRIVSLAYLRPGKTQAEKDAAAAKRATLADKWFAKFGTGHA